MLSIPEPESVLRDLSNLWPIIYSAMDYGTYRALEFFEKQEAEENKKIDPFLGSHLVRYYAKEALKRDNEGHFKIENIPNSGLFLYNENYYMRIKKAYKGKLPPPGHSVSRRQYYQQQPPQLCLPLPEFREYQSGDKLNLVILWNVDPESKYKIGLISLACPKDGELSQNSVVAYWHCPVPQELLNGTGSVLHPVAVEDLPLTFSIDEETGDNY